MFKLKVLAHLLSLLKKTPTTNYNPLHTAGPVITLLIKASTVKGPAERKLAYIHQACSNSKKIAHYLIH